MALIDKDFEKKNYFDLLANVLSTLRWNIWSVKKIVVVKDKRLIIHSNKMNLLWDRKQSKTFRIQY